MLAAACSPKLQVVLAACASRKACTSVGPTMQHGLSVLRNMQGVDGDAPATRLQVSLHVDGQNVGYRKIFNAPTSQTFEGFLKAGGA